MKVIVTMELEYILPEPLEDTYGTTDPRACVDIDLNVDPMAFLADSEWTVVAVQQAASLRQENNMPRPAMTDLDTIVKVLLHLANGWVESRSDQDWLREVADEIGHLEPSEMCTCPLCQEVACDGGCPMEPHRWDYYLHPPEAR